MPVTGCNVIISCITDTESGYTERYKTFLLKHHSNQLNNCSPWKPRYVRHTNYFRPRNTNCYAILLKRWKTRLKEMLWYEDLHILQTLPVTPPEPVSPRIIELPKSSCSFWRSFIWIVLLLCAAYRGLAQKNPRCSRLIKPNCLSGLCPGRVWT